MIFGPTFAEMRDPSRLPAELRASGIGWYTTAIGLSGLAASLIGGELWTRVGPAATFIYGAVLAGLGTLALVWLVPNRRPRSTSL